MQILLPILALFGLALGSQASESVQAKSAPVESDEVKITQSTPVTSVTSAKTFNTKPDNSQSQFAGSMVVSGVSDFKETSDPSKNSYSLYQFSLGYKVDSLNTVSLAIPLQKELSQKFEERFYLDAKLSHTRKDIYRYGMMDFRHTTSLLYPTTEGSKVRDEMYTGLELSPRLDFTMNNYVKGLKLIYIPRYRRKFHKYTSNREGEYIVNESFLQYFVASWAFAKDFVFESTLVYVASRRYDGERTDDSYLTVQELQYSVNNTIGLIAGIQTGGSIINPERGESKTIEIFNENVSEFYTGASVAF